MNTTVRFTLSLMIVAGLQFISPDAFAGGGGSGSKIKVSVRVKNITTEAANLPLVTIETVEVGDPMNDPITFNFEPIGQVATTFRMAKYEVTIADYVAFLNAVAKRGDGANATVIASLYDERMATDTTIAGIARSGSGTEAAPYVYLVIGDREKPIAYIDWFSAARFANWMHNGATATADIESGAYNLAGGFSPYVTRESGAKWWIPSHDEWFKAAYYKGGSTSAGYWMFPTRSDTACETTPSTGTNHANSLQLGVYAVTQATTLDATQNYLTAVGTYNSSPGPYGTFDQGGNLEEWTDDVLYSPTYGSKRTRGGAWNSGGLNDDVNPIPTALPTDRSSKIGFRLARSATAQGPATATSRTLLVRADTAKNRRLMPGEITQFQVKKGTFHLTVIDSDVTGVSKTEGFNTKALKTVYIEISGDGSQVTIAEAVKRF